MQSPSLQPLRSQSDPESSTLPVVHQVKEQPRNFEQLIQFPRPRPWELRKNDRRYKTGDGLRIAEWVRHPKGTVADDGGFYTGRSALCLITWTSDEWPAAGETVGLPSDLILLGVEVLQVVDERPITERIEEAHDGWVFLKSQLDPGPPVPYTPPCPGLRVGAACVLGAGHDGDCRFEVAT
jgi:hypothetical protein